MSAKTAGHTPAANDEECFVNVDDFVRLYAEAEMGADAAPDVDQQYRERLAREP